MTPDTTNTQPPDQENEIDVSLTSAERTLSLDMQKLALRRILDTSKEIHAKIKAKFTPTFTLKFDETYGQRSPALDLIYSNQTTYTQAEELLLRKVQESISGEDLRKVELIPVKLKSESVVFPTGSVTCDVEFETNRFRGKSEAAIKKMITDQIALPPPASITDLGINISAAIAVDPPDVAVLAKTIHDKLASRKALRGTFAGHGMKESHVQMAMAFAQHMTEPEISNAMEVDVAKLAKEEKEVSAKLQLFPSLEQLDRIAAQPESDGEAEAELNAIRADRAMTAGAAVQSKVLQLAINGAFGPATFPAITPTNEPGYRGNLAEASKKYSEIRANYKHVSQAIVRIEGILNTATIPLPTELTGIPILPGPPRAVDPTALTGALDPQALASALRSKLEVASKAELETKIADLKKKQKDGAGKKKSGSDAVLAIYKAYAKKLEPAGSETEWQNAANALFTRNVIDNGMVLDVRNHLEEILLDMDKDREGYSRDAGRWMKEWLVGSEKTFVKNIYKGARISGSLEAVAEEHPERLVRAYMALRESIVAGHITSNDKVSTYLFEELARMGQLIVSHSLTKEWFLELGAEEDPHVEGDAKHKKSKAAEVSASFASAKGSSKTLLEVPLSAMSEKEQARVKKIMQKAVDATGGKRRAFGRGLKTAVGVPTNFAVDAVKGTASLANDVIIQTPKNAIGGIMSGIRFSLGFVWDKATERRNFLTGEKAGGTHHETSHA